MKTFANFCPRHISNTMEAKLQSILLPLCHSGDGSGILEKVGTNPIFDRNVVGLIVQFAVRPIRVKFIALNQLSTEKPYTPVSLPMGFRG